MPVNAGYEYANAEKLYALAQTTEEKIDALKEMIKAAPKHKSSENFVANLKQRLNKLIEKKEKARKTGKTTQKVIRKEGFQCVIIGLPNSGKSSVISKITNASPLISNYPFSTKEPVIGTFEHKGFKAQVIDMPSIGSEYFDTGIIHTADCIIIVIELLEELDKINPLLERTIGKKIIVINKSDKLSSEEKRKLEARIKSKKIDALLISAINNQNIDLLKDKIISSMNLIRVYLKEPGKNHSNIPMILKTNSTVYDCAEHILNGFSKKVKETRISGPSSKFPNQRVGLYHVLKDLDIVEFHTK
jgi:hypothetical protein